MVSISLKIFFQDKSFFDNNILLRDRILNKNLRIKNAGRKEKKVLFTSRPFISEIPELIQVFENLLTFIKLREISSKQLKVNRSSQTIISVSLFKFLRKSLFSNNN